MKVKLAEVVESLKTRRKLKEVEGKDTQKSQEMSKKSRDIRKVEMVKKLV